LGQTGEVTNSQICLEFDLTLGLTKFEQNVQLWWVRNSIPVDKRTSSQGECLKFLEATKTATKQDI